MVWAILSACSFTEFDYAPCHEPVDCRDAFGFGSTCGKDGYCQPMSTYDRCAEAWPPDVLTNPHAYRDHIVLASVFDSAYDRLDQQATELALIGVDAQGGLDGTEYAILQCDYNTDGSTHYDTDDEQTVMTKIGTWLAEEAGVPAIIGPSTSSSTQSMFPTTGNKGILLVSPSASSPALTYLDGVTHTDDDPGMLWRTVPSDAAQARAIAADMADRGVDSVGVIAVTGAYGEGLANAFLDEFTAPDHVIDIYTFDEDDVALLGEHMLSVANGTYDEVLYVGSTVGSVARFLNGAQTFPAFADGDKQIFLTDAARYDSLFESTTEAEGLYGFVRGTSPAAPSGPVYESFRGAYASEFNGDSADGSIYTSYAFDAAWLLVYGTAWATYQEGDITGLGIARGLRQVSDGADVPIRTTSWTNVTANFEAGNSVDVEGASGLLDFDPETEETTNAVDLWHLVDDGGWGFENTETIAAE